MSWTAFSSWAKTISSWFDLDKEVGNRKGWLSFVSTTLTVTDCWIFALRSISTCVESKRGKWNRQASWIKHFVSLPFRWYGILYIVLGSWQWKAVETLNIKMGVWINEKVGAGILERHIRMEERQVYSEWNVCLIKKVDAGAWPGIVIKPASTKKWLLPTGQLHDVLFFFYSCPVTNRCLDFKTMHNGYIIHFYPRYHSTNRSIQEARHKQYVSGSSKQLKLDSCNSFGYTTHKSFSLFKVCIFFLQRPVIR